MYLMQCTVHNRFLALLDIMAHNVRYLDYQTDVKHPQEARAYSSTEK